MPLYRRRIYRTNQGTVPQEEVITKWIKYYLLFYYREDFCFGVFISFGIMKQYHSKRYGRISSSVFLEHHLERIYQIFSRSRAFIKINNEIAYKVSVFNTLSFEKNRRIGTAVVLLFLILMFILSVIITLIYLPCFGILPLYILFLSILRHCLFYNFFLK